jgi:hypothetical protein
MAHLGGYEMTSNISVMQMRTNKLILFIFVLLLCEQACAASNYYVDGTVGNDACDGGSPIKNFGTQGPWLTIQHAIDSVGIGASVINIAAGTYSVSGGYAAAYFGTDKNGKDITLNGANKATTILSRTTNSDYGIYSDMASGTLTVNNLTVSSTQATFYVTRVDGIAPVTFNNCILGDSVPTNQRGSMAGANGNADRILTFNNCMFVTKGAADVFYIVDGSLNVNGCTFAGKSTGRVAYYQGLMGDVNLSNNAVTNLSQGAFFYAGTYTGLKAVTIRNNVININNDYGIYIPSYAANTYIADNAIKMVKIGNSHGISLGMNLAANDHNLGPILVKNNTLNISGGAGSEHGLLVGFGCDGADISNNKIIGPTIGLVLKANNIKSLNNLVYGGNCLYLKGTSLSLVKNCTFITNGAGGYAGWVLDSTLPAVAGNNNVVTDCIFDGSRGLWALNVAAGATFGNDYFNNNCYYGGYWGVVTLDGSTNLSTIAALTSAWTTAGTTLMSKSNDTDSIYADPQFRNAAYGDFSLKPNSPCLNAGQGTPLDGKTTIGAWQPSFSYEGDFNTDGVVNFYDFSIFAQHWLEGAEL